MSFNAGLIGSSRRRAAVGGEEPGGGDLEPVSATYWRLKMPWAANNIVHQVGEVEMRATEGGADQCSGGTASASSSSDDAYKAFDNDTGASWNVTSPGFNLYLQYQFASAVEVTELSIFCANSAYVPTVVALQYSDGGASWSEWAHWSGLSWTDNETKVLNAANRNVIPAGASPLWRVRITDNNGNGNCEVTEIEFRASAGGANEASGGQPIGRSEATGNAWNVSNAFDGELNSTASVIGMTSAPMWAGYLFPSNVAVVEVGVRADTQRSSAPKDFTIDYSNDWGLTWTTVHTATDQIDWASEEMRLFDLTVAATSGVTGDWYIDMGRVAAGWFISDYVTTAENVSGGNADPGFVLSRKSLGTSLKRYWEVEVIARASAGGNPNQIGICLDSQRAFYQSLTLGSRTSCVAYRSDGNIYRQNSLQATDPSWTTGDIIMVAYDPAADTVRFGKNGTWGTTVATVDGGEFYAAMALYDVGDKLRLIGNEAEVAYAKPAGFHDLAA